MTQEEKDLLLRDLSARLPYGVKIETECGIEVLDTLIVSNGWINASYDIDEVKPYLRPMSSMTEEERKDWCSYSCTIWDNEKDTHSYIERKVFSQSLGLDWLNTHHFDYRGLIEKGLALEAPEGMYNIKEK